MIFKLKSTFKPAGDQPQAIDKLIRGVKKGRTNQVLLGVTGSGKTYTIAKVIEKLQLPTLVISHNKTLAAQLYQEFKAFFPKNAVSYFVSYYDYYQPEAYIASTDTYIEKETDVNEEIEKLRLKATTNLLTRQDVIITASVSCIYNLGSPKEYGNYTLNLTIGQQYSQRELLENLSELQYERKDFDLNYGSYSLKGDILDIWPAYQNNLIRCQFLEDNLEKITMIDPLTKTVKNQKTLTNFILYPAKHYMINPQKQKQAFSQIKDDLQKQLKYFRKKARLLEAHRLEQKVSHDLEMIKELGYVNGIENYSIYFDNRKPGQAPYTLLDYFKLAVKKNWLLIIDESHMTIPQIRGMYYGDLSRKQTLIDYGFRLPSALDNRPLRFDEFLRRIGKTIYVSATPADWEINYSQGYIIQQLLRPTGLVDPQIEIRPTANQIPDIIKEILKRVAKKQRVLITTLTKRLAEDLTDYLNDRKKLKAFISKGKKIRFPKIAYFHSEIHTLERQEILNDLRLGKYDVLIGINLLREGLDLPEVSLVIILDADKQGFLRSKTSLIQTMGRAARHLKGKILMYADKKSLAMKEAIDEVARRRRIQLDYNQKHQITPVSISKKIRSKLANIDKSKHLATSQEIKLTPKSKPIKINSIKIENYDPQDKAKIKKQLTKAMLGAAKALEFEKASLIRDKIKELF